MKILSRPQADRLRRILEMIRRGTRSGVYVNAGYFCAELEVCRRTILLSGCPAGWGTRAGGVRRERTPRDRPRLLTPAAACAGALKGRKNIVRGGAPGTRREEVDRIAAW